MRSCALVVCELVVFGFKLSVVHPLPVLNLSNDENENEVSRQGSRQNTPMDMLVDYYTKPEVDVFIRGTSEPPTTYHTSVPVMPDMSPLTAFIFATRQYSRLNGRSADNPFNIAFLWDEFKGCYVVTAAVGVETSSTRSWHVLIRSTYGQFLYFSQCFPMEDDVILRPGYQLILVYARNDLGQP